MYCNKPKLISATLNHNIMFSEHNITVPLIKGKFIIGNTGFILVNYIDKTVLWYFGNFSLNKFGHQ